MPAWLPQALVSWACRWPLDRPSECLQVKDTDHGPFLLLLTPSHPATTPLFSADLFYSCYQIPSPKFSDTRRPDPPVPFPYPTLTLFSENIAELTHLNQKFTVCDLGGLFWLIALPGIHEKEPVIGEYNLFPKQEIGTVIKSFQ